MNTINIDCDKKAKDDNDVSGITADTEDGDCSAELSKKIKNLDLYDKLAFERISVKRNSIKGKTNIVQKSRKLNIEKFSEDIIKYTEDISHLLHSQSLGENRKKKTIKFAT